MRFPYVNERSLKLCTTAKLVGSWFCRARKIGVFGSVESSLARAARRGSCRRGRSREIKPGISITLKTNVMANAS